MTTLPGRAAGAPRTTATTAGGGAPGPGPRPVVLLLPGQGAQYEGMAVGLYDTEPVFTAAMDEVFGLMGPEGRRVRADWLSDRPAVPLDDVTRAQALLFAVDHALARLVLGWGIRPAAVLGHSVGELVGAVLTGVLDLPDAVRLQTDRISRISAAPPGGMLAVAARREELTPYLGEQVVVGVVNGAKQCVLAGPEAELAQVEAGLRVDGFLCRRTRAFQGFHSPSLAAAAAQSLPTVAALRLSPPSPVLYSGYTAGPLTPGQATDPAFWAGQPAAPVLFGPALGHLLDSGRYVLVEAGPGQGLTALARRRPAVVSGRSAAVPTLPARRGVPADDRRTVRAAAAFLRAEGYASVPAVPAPA
ncbi:acyltransferase domain-containing protein [Kitasatospora sp. NPDC059577]|uniref:acyltransferase domain-containing protein n=1 Tax=Kitasatospora sp. NPDC059577 TaxID=3346873 RepID=UPI003674B3C7